MRGPICRQVEKDGRCCLFRRSSPPSTKYASRCGADVTLSRRLGVTGACQNETARRKRRAVCCLMMDGPGGRAATASGGRLLAVGLEPAIDQCHDGIDLGVAHALL